MKVLIVATSAKPPNFEKELNSGRRYRLEYLDLSKSLSASYMDYDSPWMHNRLLIRRIEEKIHLDFFWAREIANKVKEEGYEVVISMSERIAVPLALFLDKQVKHVAILINALSPKWLMVIKTLKIYRNWDKIVTYSRAEAEALEQELQLKSGEIEYIHNYVDTDFYKPLGTNEFGQNGSFIISQGVAKRDYPTLIKAMQELPHIECHISAVSAWDKYEAGYEHLEIPDNVLIKPYDHPYLIRDVFSKCRFVVISLRHDVGMWCSGSTSVLQAQAMGKPVVTTFLPGIAEYVQDGKTGFLVEGNNPPALAEKIDYLWRYPQKATEMGQRGHAWVEENYSLETWIGKMVNLVEELV